jgi:hypothetical protein
VTGDTGHATAEQLALILTTQRADDADSWTRASDAEILAHVRNTLSLPGERVVGAFPVMDDGSAYAAALIAYLTPKSSTS